MATACVVGSLASSLTLFRRHLLVTLRETGWRVLACAPFESTEVSHEITNLGVEFVPIRLRRAGISPIRDVGLVLQLISVFAKSRPNIVICYTVKPVIFGTVAARIAGVPRRVALITGLGYAFTSSDGGRQILRSVVSALYRFALAGATDIFFQNPDDLSLFRELGILRADASVSVISGSGVDLNYFRSSPLPKEARFLMIGRYLEDKGLREYIAAARLVKRKYPQASFQIAGWSDENPSAIPPSTVAAWVREGVVEDLGRLNTSEVRAAISRCRVYVLPSYREGTPRTVLEAMAMARPIVTTDAPGCRETTEDGRNGFLVPVQTIEPLAAAMERFIVEPSLAERMGAESRRRAEQKYDVLAVTALFMETLGVR